MMNYHVYEEIGKGQNCIVYKGRRKQSIEYVAVKKLDKSRRKKVINEAKILHCLSHPNIIKYHNWYETKNHLWLIYEYCAGGDLHELIKRDKQVSETSVQCFGRDLVHALLYLHSRGIIFGDLKPSNVLIDEYGTLKLGNFGLAKKVEDNQSTVKKGTPFYMAPELFKDEGIHSFASDFWALGCVLYELATGSPPFVATNFSELVELVLNSEVKGLDKLSPELRDLVNGLLQKDPSKRIRWDELKRHAFWNSCEFPHVKIPSEPYFETFLKMKGLEVQPYLSLIKED